MIRGARAAVSKGLTALLTLSLTLCAGPVHAGLLTSTGVAILDSTGGSRTAFSSNERITFQQRVHNGSASSNRIHFTFRVFAPTGAQVFTHSGNAVPGRVGNAASHIGGIPISGFYSGPGVYTMKALAELDGSDIEQQATFTLSSPNVLLLYPPNGAQNVSDKPLTFRWSSSGADRYRVIVGDNPSLYNAVYSGETSGGENYLAYPENPSDQRQRLSAGQVYYWKVEGLDSGGDKIAESAEPFSFTVEAAALTRDCAVTALETTGKSGTSVMFRVVAKNQGGTAENGISLKFSLGGLPAPGTPVTLNLQAGDEKEYSFTTTFPPDQAKSLAIACVEFFDDNVANNCKTLQIEQAVETDTPIMDRPVSADEVWASLQDLLRQQGTDLSDYDVEELDEQMTQSELEALIDGLRTGLVDVTVTGPPTTEDEALAGTTPELPIAGVPAPVPGAGSEGEDEEVELVEAWDAIKTGLGDVGVDLGDYELDSVDEGLTQSELETILDQIKSGEAQVEVTGPPVEIVDAGDEETETGSGGAPALLDRPDEEVELVEAWDAIKTGLGDVGVDLGDYELDAVDEGLTQAELETILDQIKSGEAQVDLSGPPTGGATGEEETEETASGPPVAVPVAVPGEEEALGLGEVWDAVKTGLEDAGVSLDGYEIDSIDEGLTRSELDTMLDQIKSGEAQVDVSGPVSSGAETVVESEAAEVEDAAPAPPPMSADAEEEDTEWRGFAPPRMDSVETVTLRKQKTFKKFWRRISDTKPPKVKFKNHIVVGVMGGRKDRIEYLEISEIDETLWGVVVRYRVRKTPVGVGMKAKVPYHLKVIKKTGKAVKFEAVEIKR